MIRLEIVGDSELRARLEKMPSLLRVALLRAVTASAFKLQARVQRTKLTGQALTVRTGRLRSLITQRVEQDGSSITGIVGTNVSYAARHEYGFKGSETVREHLRTVKKAFGKPLAQPTTSIVRQYSRTVNYPARSFLRTALAEMRPKIVAAMRQAAKEATDGA